MVEKKKTKAKSPPKATKKKKTTKTVSVKEEVVQAAVQPKIAAPLPPPPRPKKEKLPKGPRYYGTGRRKEAVAKVWLTPGSGQFKINGKSLAEYFCGRKLLEYQILRPLVVTNTQENYDVNVEAHGGGIPGQAGAVSHGLARALLGVSPDFRVKLKREGLLRRDPRMKERKKYGLKRARRAFQYSKR